MRIKEITSEFSSQLLMNVEDSNYRPLGKFYLKEDDKYIGIDNETGEAWTEEFNSLQKCIAWLQGEELETELKLYWASDVEYEDTGEFLSHVYIVAEDEEKAINAFIEHMNLGHGTYLYHWNGECDDVEEVIKEATHINLESPGIYYI